MPSIGSERMNELFSLPPCKNELFRLAKHAHTGTMKQKKTIESKHQIESNCTLTTIEYVMSEFAVFGLSRSIAWIPRNTVRPTGVNCVK